MLTIKEYVKAESLAQAYELNQKKVNRLLGGMLWLKMQNTQINAAIDLSGLGLDFITETEDEFSIGAMTSLRSLELHEGLNAYTQGAMKESLRHIVGVQFRNLATVGGSLFGRYGFSDVLTMFMAMDSYVELYRAGIVSMEEFAAMPYDRDILVRILVKKTPRSFAYLSHRNTRTDFPVITCAVSLLKGEPFSQTASASLDVPDASFAGERNLQKTFVTQPVRVCFGARPHRSVLFTDEASRLAREISEESIEAFWNDVDEKLVTGTNTRASGEYRRHLSRVLLKRALLQAGGKNV